MEKSEKQNRMKESRRIKTKDVYFTYENTGQKKCVRDMINEKKKKRNGKIFKK